MSTEEIETRITNVLLEVINVDKTDIVSEATLQGDLGAESLDFLDIVFRLECELGIRIPRIELFPEAILQGDPRFVQNGKVTDRGLDELRQRMPFADFNVLEHDRLLSSVPDLFTVGLLIRYISWKLKQQQRLRSDQLLGEAAVTTILEDAR